MLLVERLYEFECLFGRIAVRFVALNLQRGEVKQPRRIFCTFLLLNRCDGERQIFDAVNQRLRFLKRSKALEIIAVGVVSVFAFLNIFGRNVAE